MLDVAKLTPAERLHAAAVQSAAARYGVPAALLAAIVWQESRWNANAQNLTGGDGARGGSWGLAQMSLATARGMGYSGSGAGLKTVSINLDYAGRHLGWLLKSAGANGYGFDSVVSAYNAGSSAHRPGDGKRVGTIAQATPAAAKRVPFVNQAAYVNPVLAQLSHYAAAGFDASAPAYAAGAEALPSWIIWAGVGLVLLAF